MKRLSSILVLLFISAPLSAQNVPIEALSDLSFNFGNPGARSLAMGGAFLALADDASAAEANPAGLTILSRSEVSLEVRQIETSQTFLISNATSNTFSDDETQVSFASFVQPWANFVLGAYYHKPLAQSNETGTVFQNVNAGTLELTPFTNSLNIEIETFGLSGAWRVDRLSLGVGVRYQSLDQNASSVRLLSATDTFSATQTADDSDVTFSAGLKWEVTDRFNVGAAYKQGASFDAPFNTVSQLSGGQPVRVEHSADFNVPDIFGAGIALRPLANQSWWILADVNRVTYGDLADNVVGTDGVPRQDFKIDDGTEIRVGTEYTFRLAVPLSIRAGYWKDPAHRLQYTGPTNTISGAAFGFLFPREADDEDHLTFGVGAVFSNFQIDIGYDDGGDSGSIASVSSVFRF